jgi:hypothetical protein
MTAQMTLLIFPSGRGEPLAALAAVTGAGAAAPPECRKRLVAPMLGTI